MIYSRWLVGDSSDVTELKMEANSEIKTSLKNIQY